MKRVKEQAAPWITRLKWGAVVLCFCMLEASVIALAPSVFFLQTETLARSTTCVQDGDCAAMVAKRGGLAASINSMLKLLCAAPYGVAADTYGRRPLYLIAATGPLLTLPWLLGQPSTLTPFYVMTAISGFMPPSSQLITLMIVDMTNAGERFRLMSLFSLGNMAVALSANLLGASVVAKIGLEGILMVTIAVVINNCVVLFLVLPETSKQKIAEEEELQEAQEVQEVSSPALSAGKKEALRRQTSMNIGQVLFKSKNIDADHQWECRAFWLYLLAELPDSIGVSQLQLLISFMFGYTVADFGQLSSVLMFYQFFWLAVGSKMLKKFLVNEARIFQVVMGITFAGDLLFYFWSSPWNPYVCMLLATANGLVGLTLQSLILDVTADHRQGKILGFLTATDRLCGVIGPGLGGGLFSFAVETFGSPRWVFLCFFCVLKPLSIVIASNTMTRGSMPEALKDRIDAARLKAGIKDRDPKMGM